MSPPTYAERLRVEGIALTAAGAVGSAALLALRPEQATRWPLNTAAQLAAVAALLGWLAPRATRKALEEARPLDPGQGGTGEPTPLWQLPVIVAGLTATFVALGEVEERAGWDAGLRVTLGCVLVGLAQTLVIGRLVAADERRRGRRYVRLAGSRILRGTVLGWRPA